MSANDPTRRFSDRVADYVRHRPDYPPALLHWLRRELGASPSWRVADVGAGTGIASKMFLDAGYRVTAVEPNAPMREAAVAWLGGDPRFRAVDGAADATGLPDASVDLVAVAQAFHWFDPPAARREFARILRPGGLAAIWWNSRRLAGTPFLEGYEALLREYGTDYAAVAERHADDASMRAWFGTGLRGEAHFAHAQRLDFDGLLGRLLSSSYAPRPGHPRHEPMKRALRALFDTCAVDGTVSFDYDTRVFAGEVT
ncbi:methyltransferase family protein [Fulvimonas soli]|jgi:SAM-dependent methyltransferase|uniref:Methyltransferase family protein n=1 Tax=Fulvimonas soli TaxID=155197 RepID=A0A316IH96_9GAMM|nr:class I SAM-dependent methyltransferase [Fulvimonas soli]PWK92882.1 methyltransferase family protein [Fulvimonas soli]